MSAARSIHGSYTHPGLVRSGNEDSLLVSPPLYAVADGLGGHDAGEVASHIAIESLLDSAPREADATGLARAVRAANEAVIAAVTEGLGRDGMGTTMTAAMVAGTRIVIAHVGDSRAYLLRDGRLEKLTQDHSMVADMVRSGTITEQQARVHPNRSVITRALGSDPGLQVDSFEVAASPGDRLLLCSDGLHGMITDAEIERLLSAYSDPAVSARALGDAALDAGGQDNVTTVVVDISEEARPAIGGAEAARRAAPLLWALVAVALVASAAWGAWAYARSRAYLIAENGVVVVYRGVQGDFAGVRLAWRELETTVPVDALSPDRAARLREGITEKDLADAYEAVAAYRASVSTETTAP